MSACRYLAYSGQPGPAKARLRSSTRPIAPCGANWLVSALQDVLPAPSPGLAVARPRPSTPLDHLRPSHLVHSAR